jgi:hypothetical protein
MSADHFTPWLPEERRPCWTCTGFDGVTAGGSAALCNRPNSARVRASPATGCCNWERELGTDDEPGQAPEGFSVLPPHAGPWRAQEGPPAAVVVQWAP